MAFELEFNADISKLLDGLLKAKQAVADLRITGKIAQTDIQAGFTKTASGIILFDQKLQSAGQQASQLATGLAQIGAGEQIAEAANEQAGLNEQLAITINSLNLMANVEIKSAAQFIDFTNKKHVALQEQIRDLQRIQQLSRSAVGTESQQEVIRVLSEQVAKAKELRTEIETPFSGDPVGNTTNAYKTLVTQIRQGTAELAAARIQFGANSEEATKLAARVGDLQRQLRGAREQIAAFDPERRFNALSQSVQGVVGGFTALQGAMTFLGVRSETAAVQLAKIQGLLAFSQGINQVLSLRGAFTNLLGTMGIVTKNIDGTTKSFKQLTAAFLVNPITIAIAAVAALAAVFAELNEQQEENLKILREEESAARKHAFELEKLKIQYQETTGAISGTTAAIRLLNLEQQNSEQELQAEAINKATDAHNSWFNSLLRGIPVFGQYTKGATAYNDTLKEEEKSNKKVVESQRAKIVVMEAELKAKEALTISNSIFNESLERNELTAKNDIDLLRIRLSNIKIQQEKELKQTEGNELKKQEIQIRFANERKKIEQELFVAINKRAEELLVVQKSLIERAQAAELSTLTDEDRINREREIGEKEIAEVRKTLQTKILLNEEADKQISQQRLTRLLEVPEVVRTDQQKDEIDRLVSQVKLSSEQLAAIDVILIANTKIANDKLQALQEVRINTRISLIQDEEKRAIAEFIQQFKEREDKIRDALTAEGKTEAEITEVIELKKNEGVNIIKTKFRNEDLQREFEYQENLINAKKVGSQEEIKNETERQIKLAELRILFLKNESLNLDTTTEEGRLRQSQIDAEFRQLTTKVDQLKAQLKSNKITWADIFGFTGESQEEIDKFNEAMSVAASQVKALGVSILESLQSAGELTIQQHENQLSLIEDAIAQKEQQIQTEEELNRQGLANNLDVRKKELAALKAQKEQERKELIKSYQEQQKLARIRIILSGVESAAALATATANLFESQSLLGPVGIAIAAGAAAAMIALFLSIKSKIAAATAPPTLAAEGGQFKNGELIEGRRIIRGRSHSHPSKGHRIEGTNLFIEHNEEIISNKKRERYNALLNGIQLNDFSGVTINELRNLPQIRVKQEEITKLSESKQVIKSKEVLQAINVYNKGVEQRIDKLNATVSTLSKRLLEDEKVNYGPDGTRYIHKGNTFTIVRPQ